MIGYLLFRLVIFIFHFVPFWLLYAISDVFAFLNYHLIGYRKKVIVKNLSESFPEKSQKEINTLTKLYYKHLSDILLESLKGYTMPIKKLSKMFDFKNLDIVNDHYFDSGKSLIFVSGHAGNWELGTRLAPFFYKHEISILYKPLSNKHIDKFVKNFRQRENSRLVSITETSKAFENHSKPFIVGLLSDQRTRKSAKLPEIDFLNHKTQFLPGIEIYAERTKLPVIFFWVNKLGRGKYEVVIDKITDNETNAEPWKITRIFVQKMEQKILENPVNWLWSHNRWK